MFFLDMYLQDYLIVSLIWEFGFIAKTATIHFSSLLPGLVVIEV